MKKTLFATAFAVAAMACAPAFAQPTGYVGATANWAQVKVSGVKDDGDAYGVHGALSTPLSEALSAQFAASYTDSDNSDGVFAAQAHLVGDVGAGRIGAFVGAADVADETALAAGVEGQANLSQVSLVGTVAYANVDELDLDLWGVSGEARFFATDNFRLDASLGWASADAGGGSADIWTMGVGGEYQFANNVSLFGGYNHVEVDDVDLKADSVSIGIRYNWGGSLRERNDNGANFGGVGSLLSAASFF